MVKNGIINLNKPIGPSSSDMVVRVRNILTRLYGEKVKVGHLGTLDPAAEGVLPVAVGRATKLFDAYLKKTKRYRAGIVFGKTNETLDREGKEIITDEKFTSVSKEQLEEVLKKFVGVIKQVPPAYSALNIGGVRAYKLAREGKAFEIPERETTVFELKLLECTDDTAVIEVECSSGTYIRSLVRDIALEAGTLGYMSFLVRLKSGEFDLKDSVTLEDFQKDPERYIDERI